MKCSDCPSELNVYLVYSNSYFGVCENCLIERLKSFHIFSRKSEGHPPIIVPKEFIDVKEHKYWFPNIIIQFGETKTMYGMLIEDFKKWQEQALASVEFNIP